jgi:hypothetical protein
MKNIHVLPTEKPTILYIVSGKLTIGDYITEREISHIENQHIYITSDEEISGFENDIWVIQGTRVFLWKNTMALVFDNKPRKIILTTDQDLIKDGVQAIDDEFLQWFVKNPSCEEVEVDRDEREVGNHLGGVVTEYGDYKIIIPKEEVQQYCEYCKQPISKYGCGCAKQKEEAKQNYIKCTCANSLEYSNCAKKCERILDEQQETLEEVAHKMLSDYGINSMGQSIGVLEVKKLMVKIAKWQQEQDKNKYSEEEVKQMLIDCCGEVSCEDGVLLGKTVAELYCWIDEKFKKK